MIFERMTEEGIMKHLKILFLFAVSLVFVCNHAAAWELNGVLREWNITPLRPYDIAVLKNGSIWMTVHDPSSGAWPFGKIFRFNPADGSTTEFSVPPAWGSCGFVQLVGGTDDTLWITDQEDRIVHFNPATATFTPFGLNGAVFNLPATPSDIALAPDGAVWFNCTTDRCLGRLDPTTGAWQRFAPSPADALPDHPNQLTVGPDGIVWFTVGHGAVPRLGRLNPGTKVFSLLDTVPFTGAMSPFGVIVLDGMIWFLDHQANQLVRYNPGSGVFTTYNTMPDLQDAHFLIADPDGIIWLTAFVTSRIGRFAPATGTFSTVAFAGGSAYPMGIALSPGGEVWWAETVSMDHGGTGRLTPVQPLGITIGNGAVWDMNNASMDMSCLRLFIKNGGEFDVGSGSILRCGRIQRDTGGTLIRGTGSIGYCLGFLPATMLLLGL